MPYEEGGRGQLTLFICFKLAFCCSNSCLADLRALCDEEEGQCECDEEGRAV